MKPELDDLIDHAGRAEFRRACEQARRDAPGTSARGRLEDLSPNLAFDLEEWVWDESSLGPVEKVSLTFLLYECMPCYWLVSSLSRHYDELPPEARALCHDRFRRLLTSEDSALAGPAAYSLWCDHFENLGRVDEWWRALAGAGAPDRLLQRVLKASGPVPYTFKEALYERLLPEDRWHTHIAHSLLNSCLEAYGQVDLARARRLFRRLRLPPDTEHLDAMRARLG